MPACVAAHVGTEIPALILALLLRENTPMAEQSSIEWTDATWNPITGCSVVSPGCTNCYAMKLAGTRLQHHPSRAGLTVDSKAGPVWNGQLRFNEDWLDQPLKWKRPRMIFVCAHGDLFHESVPDEWIDRVFAVMALAPQHTFQVLTKRAERMRRYMQQPDTVRRIYELACDMCIERRLRVVLLAPGVADPEIALSFPRVQLGRWPIANVWLGVSVEDQKRADERIPHLLATPAAVRFLSCEPLLGPIDRIDMPCMHWVIVGGESGPGARPMHPAWARALRDQCARAGVPFFFKQWGAWKHMPERSHVRDFLPEEWQRVHSQMDGVRPALMFNIGKKAAGRLLDGVEHNAMPGRQREAT